MSDQVVGLSPTCATATVAEDIMLHHPSQPRLSHGAH